MRTAWILLSIELPTRQIASAFISSQRFPDPPEGFAFVDVCGANAQDDGTARRDVIERAELVAPWVLPLLEVGPDPEAITHPDVPHPHFEDDSVHQIAPTVTTRDHLPVSPRAASAGDTAGTSETREADGTDRSVSTDRPPPTGPSVLEIELPDLPDDTADTD